MKWLEVIPGTKKNSVFSDPEFTTLVKWFLGCLQYRHEFECDGGDMVDVFEDHSVICRENGDKIYRYNRLRGALKLLKRQACIQSRKRSLGITRSGQMIFSFFSSEGTMMWMLKMWPNSPWLQWRLSSYRRSAKVLEDILKSMKNADVLTDL
eukprot:TRINITY_DN2784_c0_g1_i1.p1 TRINITY_DN2784_c0_g1~~TRINITY_DN2784_c0_g1_i1.p1  ORF type:complete len:152 (+),score=8.31 TRINITY_DN2784_c0_g1_i1:218-673(+)